ncbi:Rib/alpha-like domain-containing protein, partial [Falseniella ignava]
MVGKNNKKLLREKQSNKVYKYAIKRLTFGVASVAISAGLLFAGGTIASAEEALAEGATAQEFTASGTETGEEGAEGADINPTGEPVTVLTDESDVEEPQDETTAENMGETVGQSEEDKGIQFTEAQKAQLRHAGFTEEEIIALEVEAQTEGVTAVEAFITQKIVERNQPIQTRSAETEPELELSEEEEKEAVGAAANNETYKASASKTRVNYTKGTVGDAKEAIDKDNLAKLPEGTKFEWVDNTIFDGVGDILAEIKVTYPDGTTEIIKAPINVSNSYEIDGERYSGNFYSDEKKAKTTSNGQLNVGFKMGSLESQESRDQNELGMEMSTIFGGGITASGRDKMDGYLELDDRLAKYVDRIEGSRNGNGTYNYVWERVRNSRGELTNTWKRKAFSMLAEPENKEPGRKTIFRGDAPEVTQTNNSNKIIFKKSLKDIIDKEVPNVENGDLIYRFFIADENMVIQNQSIADGTIKVGRDKSEEHPEATATNNRNWFSGSHGTTTYQPDAGENGGIAFDHFLNKNSDGGTLNSYRNMQNREFAYKFQVDPRLLPYIDSVKAYYMDGSLIGGYNSKEFKAENEHSQYFANSKSGLAGYQREGWVEYEMRFNNGENIQSQYTAGPDGNPQTGIRGSKGPAAWFDTTKGAAEKSSYLYKDLKAGEGYFTIKNAPIDFGSQQLNFADGTTQAGAIRLVANFKKGVDLNKILGDNDGKDSNYYISGYMVNSKEELIPGTVSSGHIRVVDVDADGIADDIDDDVNIPEVPSDSDKYTPVAKNVTTQVGTVPDAKEGIEKVTDSQDNDASDKVKSYHWEKTPDVSKEGTFDNAVIVTYEDGTSERVATKIIVTDDRKDNEKYDPKVTPIEKEKGTATTEDEVKGAVTVPDYPADAEKQPEIKVDDPTQLPDGKTIGEYDVDVTVTYPDGSEDKVKVKVTVKDTTAPVITPIDDTTVIEKQPIEEITVETDDENAVVTVDGLPDGVTYDKATGKITGTPTVDDWGKEEETRDFTVTVKAEDEAGNKAEDVTFTITVQRDTDGDGEPDVTDPDDDGDGIPD